MPGIAILLFASRLNEPALDKEDPRNSNKYYNTGIKNLIQHIDNCRNEGKFGLEFIDKYPDSHKIIYSDIQKTQI